MSVGRRRPSALAATVGAVAALVAGLIVPGPAAASPAVPVTPVGTTSPCPAAPHSGEATCTVLERDAPPAASAQQAGVVPHASTAAATPITASQLRTVYGVAGLSAPAGTTVGIVVAYDAPTVEADLATFRTTNNLPACTTANGCFRKVDQRGAGVPVGKDPATAPTSADSGWQLETTLDTQAVSAMCPSCDILLVEADDTSLTASLGPAVVRAQALGASVISNSFAAPESADMTAADRSYWSTLTVPVFAGSGDAGYLNNAGSTGQGTAYYPASSPTVVSVGGTSATLRGGLLTNEKAWSGSGSGCTLGFARPAAQADYFTATNTTPDDDAYCQTSAQYAPVGGVPSRASADLSALADPYAPGFAVYVNGGWTVTGGTSLAVQLVAALAAYAGPRGAATPVGTVAYGLSARAAPTSLADVTTGTNDPSGGSGCAKQRICVARSGWDGPTGLGTPRGLSVFAPLLTVTPSTSVPGGSVMASGSDLLPGEAVTVTAADGTVLATTTAASDGTYSVAVTVPVDDPSPVDLTVAGATSGFTATRSVTFADPSLTLTPSTATDAAVVPGEQVTATLADFAANEQVTVTFPGGVGSSVVTDGSGQATTTVQVPAGATGSVTAQAFGTVSGRSASATVAVAAAAVTPLFQQVRAGSTVALQVAGFGARESLTAAPSGGGDPLATRTTAGDGTASITWKAGGAQLGTSGVTVTGATTGRSATAYVDVLAATGDVPAPPTVLSVVPTTSGGAVVGIRVAGSGPQPSTVSVLTSDGTFAGPEPVGAGGDAFVTVGAITQGAAVTVQAVAGNDVGDSALSGPSLPVTGTTAPGTGDLTPVGPVRFLDTRTTGGPLGSGASRSYPVAGRAGVPASGVDAVVLSVTVVAPTADTYLTLWPSGEARPAVSNANVGPGVVKASLVKVKLGAGGAVGVFNFSGSTNVVIDLVGFYAAGPADADTPPVFAHNQSFASVATPTRLLDTRSLASSPFRTAAGSIVVPVRGLGGVPADATGVELAVQGVGAVAQGFLTVYPTTSPRPFVSQVQFDRDRPAITSVLATLGSDGTVTVYANQGTEVIVDVVGWYAPSATGRFVSVSPRRYLDTRPASKGAGPVVTASPRAIRLAGGRALDGSTQVPSTATAVVFSLTSTDNTAPAFVTAWPTGRPRPFVTSLLPDPASGIYDNLVLSGVGSGGAVSLFVNTGSINLIVDVQGYYTTTP